MVNDADFSQKLYRDYLSYRESSLISRKIKHSDIIPLIDRLQNKNNFTVNKVGESEEGRSINLITFGRGPVKVFLWSQMHGDESTATKALFDIFNFLVADDDFNKCRMRFGKKLTVYFLPMVNPDGAEMFRRENFFNVDINRDAARMQTAEGRILYETFSGLKADFGFNLHDQDKIYTAGMTDRSAAVSFLAPAYNYKRDINKIRSRAMKLIVKIDNVISMFVPGHTAKYSDEFEPRSFGDNFQRLGTSTVLIESGTWHNDEEKQFIRKLNFIGLLGAFKSISENSYKKVELNSYENIPENQKLMLDLVIRSVRCTKMGKDYKMDIGITRKENYVKESDISIYESNIEEIGDLSVFKGFEDYELDGYLVHPGKIYPNEFNSLNEVLNIDYTEMYRQGYLFVKLQYDKIHEKPVCVPINIILPGLSLGKEYLRPGISSNFYLTKNDEIRYIILNGFLYNLRSLTGEIKNGTVYSSI